MHIHICHGAHATTGLVLAGGKSAAPGRVFSPLSETDATGTQRFVGNTECVRRLEGFLGSDKLTHACRFDLLKQDCQLRGI